MKKSPFHIVVLTCIISIFVVAGIPQTAVPIEKEPMHRLKFENEVVRIFDVLVPAGKTTDYHIHSYDGMSIPMTPPELVDVSVSGEKKALDMKLGIPSFAARPAPHTHRVINTGKTDFRNIFIEVLPSKNASTPTPFPILSDGHVVLIDNDRVRVNRLVLKPGESSKLHTHNMNGASASSYTIRRSSSSARTDRSER